MPQVLQKSLITFFVCLLAAASLTGCGRKGDPEYPGAYPLKQTTTDGKPQIDTEVDEKPFVLDPLL